MAAQDKICTPLSNFVIFFLFVVFFQMLEAKCPLCIGLNDGDVSCLQHTEAFLKSLASVDRIEVYASIYGWDCESNADECAATLDEQFGNMPTEEKAYLVRVSCDRGTIAQKIIDLVDDGDGNVNEAGLFPLLPSSGEEITQTMPQKPTVLSAAVEIAPVSLEEAAKWTSFSYSLGSFKPSSSFSFSFDGVNFEYEELHQFEMSLNQEQHESSDKFASLIEGQQFEELLLTVDGELENSDAIIQGGRVPIPVSEDVTEQHLKHEDDFPVKSASFPQNSELKSELKFNNESPAKTFLRRQTEIFSYLVQNFDYTNPSSIMMIMGSVCLIAGVVLKYTDHYRHFYGYSTIPDEEDLVL
mmetsp:Transcript_6197/g.9383  ORF Transcript_6197/g.9383 Transcript_6197/m.9383 type:complete len:356 (-) Transcript_6197:108-1175(-)